MCAYLRKLLNSSVGYGVDRVSHGRGLRFAYRVLASVGDRN